MNEGLLTGADSETITEAPPPTHTRVSAHENWKSGAHCTAYRHLTG